MIFKYYSMLSFIKLIVLQAYSRFYYMPVIMILMDYVLVKIIGLPIVFSYVYYSTILLIILSWMLVDAYDTILNSAYASRFA